MTNATRIATALLIAFAARAERVSVAILATTDLHGNLYPVDYFTERPAARGLAKISTLVRQERARNPNTLLIDCGDTIQGTPLEYVHQRQTPPRGASVPDPMMLAMNRLVYDGMTLGNHEFNFGLANLQRARSDARFPWLSANTVLAPGSRAQPFAAYLIKSVAEVKIAVIGITTPAVPTWEKPENYAGYRFEPGVEALRGALAALQPEHPDVVVVAAHAGLEGGGDGENMVRRLVTVPGIDAVVFGHSHQEVAGERMGGVLVVQPRNWGMSLARVEFTLERTPGAAWRIADKTSELLRVTPQTAADPDILELARPYHEAAERYLSAPVARAPAALDGRIGRVSDNALVDAIHAVQLHYARADVSFASLFNARIAVAAGPVSVRQLAALYIYDNELYAIEGDGRMVKEALENAARYYLSCSGEACGQGPLINRKVIGYNSDTAQGVSYEIDLSKPEGARILNLRYKGEPLAADRKLRIAVNNYRAAGSAGYEMFKRGPIVWRASQDIRQLMIDYYTEKGALPTAPDGNWRIVPELARRTLEREALAETARPGPQ